MERAPCARYAATMTARTWSALLLLLALAAQHNPAQAQQQQHRALLHARSLLAEHRFKQGDAVPLWVSKTGPFSNPRCFAACAAWGRVRGNTSKNGCCFLAVAISRFELEHPASHSRRAARTRRGQ